MIDTTRLFRRLRSPTDGFRRPRVVAPCLCIALALATIAAPAQAHRAAAFGARGDRAQAPRAPARGARTTSGSDLSQVVSGDVVVRVRWAAVAGASEYKVVSRPASGGKLTPTSAFTRLPTLDGPVGAAAKVSEWETTGYQPLGYAATVDQRAASSQTALLSPMSSTSFGDAAAPVTSLSASARAAYARQGTGGRRRYAVTATVHGHVSYASDVQASAVRAQAAGSDASEPTVTVNSKQTYQTIQGWGAGLNDADAYLLSAGVTAPLDSAAGVDELAATPSMIDLFSPTRGIGLDYIRISIGGNDYSQANYSAPASIANDYTEDDPAPGSTATSFSDTQLTTFISHDLEYQIPTLLAARQLNPSLKITAAPWTAPVWMKCTNVEAESGAACDPEPGASAAAGQDPGYGSGVLNPADEAQYADYLLEFILAYKLVGLPLSTISIQNEPGNNDGAYPTMEISPQVEAVVAEELKADERAAGVDVPILALDHNWNSNWPAVYEEAPCTPTSCYLAQLQQAAAPGTFSGVAYHCYGGSPTVQDTVTAPLYETECSTLGWYTADVDPSYPGDYTTLPESFAFTLRSDTTDLFMASTKDGDTGGKLGAGAQAVLFYNMVADDDYGPTINEGCEPVGALSEDTQPCLPVLELTGTGPPVPQAGFYVLGQFSKFVLPGAVRVAAAVPGVGTGGQVEAFRNPDGQMVLVVVNADPDACDVACLAPDTSQSFTVRWNGASFRSTIPPNTVQTYVWNGK